MDPDWDDLFSFDEIMGGLPARRASTLLFAIEGWTAQFVARSRRAMVRDYSGRTVEQEEQAFLSAMAEGADLPIEPTIQDLERYASAWAPLVPGEPSVRASLARMLGEKYQIPARMTPQLQRALGIHNAETAARFQETHGTPANSIFVSDPTPRERLRWLKSRLAMRLETLPPFWTAFALTLTETVGAGVLALPIAFAELGVLGAILLLLVLGAINILTIAAMAEAVARNGNIRYGQSYFGRLVHDLLGRPGLMILTPALLVLSSVTLLAYAIGISSTLSDSVGLSPMLWAAAVLAILVFVLRGESLDATVASALLVGICTISLLALLSLLTAPHLDSANLRHSEIPFVNGNAFDAGVLELIFGVALLALFGHTSTANCAAIVLERDPTARSLIRGAAAALGAAMVMYMLWIFMVNGSVEPGNLAGERGTALTPLADVAGPSISLFGTLFVILAMGMTAVHMGWGLVNSVREWLPPTGQTGGRLSALTATSMGRTVTSLLPLFAIFLLVELLFAFDRESFTGSLGFLGVITVPLVAGIFSMLMLAAARRKGDCLVGYTWHFLGNRFVVIGVCLLFLSAILVHGLFIWTEPLQQAIALIVSACTAIFMIVAARTSFVPRAVAEIRYSSREGEAAPIVAVVANGEPVQDVQTRTPAPADGDHGGRSDPLTEPGDSVEILIPHAPMRELKMWVHRPLADGCSLPVPAMVHLNGDEPFQLDESTGKIVLPVNGEAQRLIVRPLPEMPGAEGI